MSNQTINQSSIENKYLDFLTQNNFKYFLDQENMQIQTYNCLLTAHIASVVAQSSGVKEIKITSNFRRILSSLFPDAEIKIPLAHIEYEITLSEKNVILRHYVCQSNFSTPEIKSNIKICNKDHFDILTPLGLSKWLNNQLSFLKNFTSIQALPSNGLISINLITSNENNLIIYNEIIDNKPIVKSFLNYYFIEQKLNIKNTNKKINKI